MLLSERNQQLIVFSEAVPCAQLRPVVRECHHDDLRRALTLCGGHPLQELTTATHLFRELPIVNGRYWENRNTAVSGGSWPVPATVERPHTHARALLTRAL